MACWSAREGFGAYLHVRFEHATWRCSISANNRRPCSLCRNSLGKLRRECRFCPTHKNFMPRRRLSAAIVRRNAWARLKTQSLVILIPILSARRFASGRTSRCGCKCAPSPDLRTAFLRSLKTTATRWRSTLSGIIGFVFTRRCGQRQRWPLA
jgi:hypothetical protein